MGREAYGKVWQKCDIIGVMLDITDKTISKSQFSSDIIFVLYNFLLTDL